MTLVDAMILVAATGVGLAFIRAWSPVFYTFPYTPIPPPTWIEWSSFVVPAWAFYLMPLPAAWSLATVAIRSLHPRPPLRLAMIQAGSAAMISASLAIALGLLYLLTDSRLRSWHLGPFEYATYSAGVAVGAVWVVLASGGIWKAERTWVDRLGRVLGVYWLMMIPLVLIRPFSR